MDLDRDDVKKINIVTNKLFENKSRIKKTPEKLSLYALMVNSMILSFFLPTFLLSIRLGLIIIHFTTYNIIDFLYESLIVFIFFYIISFPISLFVLLIQYLMDRKKYEVENGMIKIYYGGLNVFGQAIFFDDILKIKHINKAPLMFYFSNELVKYTRTRTWCAYQADVYLIKLRDDYRKIKNNRIVRNERPRTRMERFFARFQNNKYVVIPKHIVEEYLYRGFQFPGHLRKNL